MRNAILAGRFAAFYQETKPLLEADDLDNPALKPKVSRKKRYPKTLGKYEVHTAIEGFSSIRHVESGEIMHSRIPPEEESRRLYIHQSFLQERLRLHGPDRPLVVWDVGLGAASNAMAALRCAEASQHGNQPSHLRIVSFENDMDPLDLALRNGSNFPYLFHSAPSSILKHGQWTSPNGAIVWDLVRGDFPDTLTGDLARPDIIFYDMFSGKSCPEAWTARTFQKLWEACDSGPSELFTYTCSTASRSAMLAAGFHVAKGCPTGAKEETTVAYTPAATRLGFVQRHPTLGQEWLARWHRSRAQTPPDIAADDDSGFRERITGHPQFRSPPTS
jgi:queuine tRNA-ribosyltransferase